MSDYDLTDEQKKAWESVFGPFSLSSEHNKREAKEWVDKYLATKSTWAALSNDLAVAKIEENHEQALAEISPFFSRPSDGGKK